MADVEYAIDVAANMPGGDVTSAQLDELTKNMMGAGKGAEFFNQAIVQVSKQLEAAKVASASTSAALKEGQTSYAQLEVAAVKASKASEKAALDELAATQKVNAARMALDAANADDVGTESIRDYEKALRRAESRLDSAATKASTLQDESDQVNTALAQQVATLAQLEAEAGDAARAEQKLAETLGNVRKLSGHVDRSFAQQAERLGKVQGSLGAIGGPLGKLGQTTLGPVKAFSELSQTIGASRTAALLAGAAAAALAVAVLALAAAAVVGVVKIAQWAVGLADSARGAGLAKEAAEALTPALAGVRSTIDGLERETGLAGADLRKLATSLDEAGVAAGDLPSALRAAALAERALGAGGSSKFIAQIKEAKGAVGDLASETQAKFGGVVARQMLGLDAQSDRLRSNVNRIFSGLNIEPVLAGMQKLVSLFDENEVAGQAIKFLFETLFQPLIDNAERAATVVEAFGLGFLIGLTKMYIAVKPVIKAVSELFGFEETAFLDLLTSAKDAGELFAKVFVAGAVVVGVIATAIAGLIAIVVGVPAAFIAAYVAIQSAMTGIGKAIGEAVSAAIDWLRGLGVNITEVGKFLIQGLANGISGAAGLVVQAMTAAVGGAIGAAKRMLGIASPSKLFAQLGEYTSEGYAQGVESAAPEAHAAVDAMVAPSESGTAAPTGASAGGESSSGAGVTIDLRGAQLSFGGADAPTSVATFGEMLRDFIKGEAAALGGAVTVLT